MAARVHNPVAELKGSFEAALAVGLAPHAYVHAAKASRFQRTAHGVTLTVHVAYIDDRPRGATDAVVNLAVRHDAVEVVVNAHRGDLPVAVQRETATLGVQLGQLVGRGQVRLMLRDGGVEMAAREALDLLVSHGLAYLDAHADLAAVERRFASLSFKDWHQLSGGRAVRWPVVLGLLGRVEEGAACLRRLSESFAPADAPTAAVYPAFAADWAVAFDSPNPLG